MHAPLWPGHEHLFVHDCTTALECACTCACASTCTKLPSHQATKSPNHQVTKNPRQAHLQEDRPSSEADAHCPKPFSSSEICSRSAKARNVVGPQLTQRSLEASLNLHEKRTNSFHRSPRCAHRSPHCFFCRCPCSTFRRSAPTTHREIKPQGGCVGIIGEACKLQLRWRRCRYGWTQGAEVIREALSHRQREVWRRRVRQRMTSVATRCTATQYCRDSADRHSASRTGTRCSTCQSSEPP